MLSGMRRGSGDQRYHLSYDLGRDRGQIESRAQHQVTDFCILQGMAFSGSQILILCKGMNVVCSSVACHAFPISFLLRKTVLTQGAFCSPWHNEKYNNATSYSERSLWQTFDRPFSMTTIKCVSFYLPQRKKKFWGFISLSVFFFPQHCCRNVKKVPRSPLNLHLRCSPFCSGGRRPWDSALRGDCNAAQQHPTHTPAALRHEI